MDKKTLLIIDDSVSDIRILSAGLSQYAILMAKSGKQGIEVALKSSPDIILMDVEMPQMNGYEASKALKSHADTQHIPIIFVSSHDTIEDIMQGYESGGCDYISKPVLAETLIPRIEVALSTQEKIQALTQQTNSLNKNSMDFISNIGEQGVIIDFLKKLYAIESFEDVGKSLLADINLFQLHGLVQIRYQNGHINLSENNMPITSLEEKVIQQFTPNKPVQSYNNRLIVNYKNFTLFVKNMPEDEALTGRLRDHMATMVAAASEKIDLLCKRQQSHEYIRKSYEILETIDERLQESLDKSLTQMEDLLYRLEDNFVTLGLSDEQEKQLISLVEQSLEESYKKHKEDKAIDSEQHRELSIILGILQNSQ